MRLSLIKTKLFRGMPPLLILSVLLIAYAPARGSNQFLQRPLHQSASPITPVAPAPTTVYLPGRFETSSIPISPLILGDEDTLISGLYRSDNQGGLWRQMTDPAYYANLLSIAASTSFKDDHTLFAGLDYATEGFKISTDNGQTWVNPQQILEGPIRLVTLSPLFEFDHIIYVAQNAYTHSGLAYSTDSGQHWTQVNLPANGSVVDQIVLSPYIAVDHTLYVRMNNSSLWRSTDNGISWQPADKNLGIGSGNTVNQLAIVPLARGQTALFAATQYALVVSVNGGQTWYLIDWVTFTDIAISDELNIVGIDQNTGQLMYSDNLGDSWLTVTPVAIAPSGSFGELIQAPSFHQAGILYAHSTSSLWRSADGGLTWHRKSSASPFIGSMWDPAFNLVPSPNYVKDQTIFAFGKQKLIRSTDGGANWYALPVPTSGEAELIIALSPSFATDRTVLATVGKALYKSTDAGLNWASTNPALPTAGLLRLSPNYRTDHTVFIGGYGEGAYRSTNDGANWTLITNGVPPFVTDLEISPAYPTDPTIFVSTYNTGLFRTNNAGVSWVNLSNPTYSPEFMLELSPAFAQDHTLFVAVNGISTGGAFRSEDQGNSWINIGGANTSYYTNRLAVSPNYAQDQSLVTGSDAGPLYFSSTRGDKWLPTQGMPIVNNKELRVTIVYEDNFPVIFATTTEKVYRYRWPRLTAPSQPLIALIDPLQTVPTLLPYTITSDDSGPQSWTVSESAEWLTPLPLSGTEHLHLNFNVDPALITQTVSTNATINVKWSETLGVTYTTPVIAAPIQSRTFFPAIRRDNSASPSPFTSQSVTPLSGDKPYLLMNLFNTRLFVYP